MSSKTINTKIQLASCDRACTSCHLKYFFEKHQENQQFDIQCGGIPSEYVSDDVLSQFSPGERNRAIGLMDPVMWAKALFNWEARPYQIELLRCSAKNKVSRMGRRTGKTTAMAVYMLWKSVVNSGHKTIVVAPLKSQTQISFDMIKTFINASSELFNSVRRIVASPYPAIEFHNGSYIRFFTAGTTSGSGANVVRGQSANLIILDEADYLDQNDVNAILAIRVESPNVEVWASSTPSGARHHFYNWNFDPDWKEFHYPSTVLPHWNEVTERQAKRDAGTELAYRHEFLAEFGEDEQGVYQKSYIQLAQRDYQYSDMIVQDGWIYTMGVDWNDTKVGTEIVVVGYNPTKNWHYIVARERVSKEGWTQTAAMEKIIQLNRIWKPAFIYIDKGYGVVQNETLIKFGWDSLKTKGPNHPDAKMRYILKTYDFGGKIEVHDPHTGQPIDKDAKPFLVNNSVRCFEQQEIKYSRHDQELTNQLHGYIIDRVTQAGRPVYKGHKKHGDHTLDALNLALLAFKLEMTKWGNPPVTANIGFGGNFGEGRGSELVSPFQIQVNLEPTRELQKRVEQIEEHRPTRGVSDEDRKPRSSLPERPDTVNTTRQILPWTRPGWDTDEEWKYVREQKRSQSARQRQQSLRKMRSGRRTTL